MASDVSADAEAELFAALPPQAVRTVSIVRARKQAKSFLFMIHPPFRGLHRFLLNKTYEPAKMFHSFQIFHGLPFSARGGTIGALITVRRRGDSQER